LSARRDRVSRRRPETPVARLSASRRWPWAWLAVIVVTVAVVLVAEHTGHGRSIVSSDQEFLLKYAGVFALIALTTAVGVGLLATDRIVMRPGHRVVAQAVHRGVSLAALTALAGHIVLEILAHRARAIDAVVPFLAQRRPLYIGLGTIASDLVVLIIVTGFLRGRFAGKWPWAWRCIHAVAYLCWPLSIVHGLNGGRAAKPYVDWSYGACLAGVALALAVRFVATTRAHEEKLSHPVPDRLSVPAEGLVPGTRVTMAPLGSAQPYQRALPSGSDRAHSIPPGKLNWTDERTLAGQMILPGGLIPPGEMTVPGQRAEPDWPASNDRPASNDWPASNDRPGQDDWTQSHDGAQR
jgi:hypothetical protein